MASASITPALKASARSTYRQLWRASSSTFGGDEPTLRAWRAKMRSDSLKARNLTEPSEYEKNIQLARDVAEVLRRNFAQAVRVDDEAGIWELRLNKHHEFGTNESIKNPPPMELPPKGRRRAKVEQVLPILTEAPSELLSPTSTSPSANVDETDVILASNVTDLSRSGTSDPVCKGEINPNHVSPLHSAEGTELDISLDQSAESARKRHNYSQLRKIAQKREMPVLDEDDLDECFVRGSGPGGQSINKTNNNVQLIHRPSGIRVVCQQTRSLELNRMYARRILLEKLDKIANPGLSKGEVQRAKHAERERRRRKKAKRREDEDEKEREERRKKRKEKRKEEKRRERDADEDDDDN